MVKQLEMVVIVTNNEGDRIESSFHAFRLTKGKKSDKIECW